MLADDVATLWQDTEAHDKLGGNTILNTSVGRSVLHIESIYMKVWKQAEMIDIAAISIGNIWY